MNSNVSVRIILKNGREFVIWCDQFKATTNGFGSLTNISWEGATKNIPMYIDVGEIVAILREELKEEESDHD